MTVTTEGVSTAGEIFSLICSLETKEGVRPEDVSITWTVPNIMRRTGEGIEIETPLYHWQHDYKQTGVLSTAYL